jgi:hypothetical protein
MRGLAAVLAAGACYAPTPVPGTTCGTGGACPDPLVCAPATNTCERSAGGPVVDANPLVPDAFVPLVDGNPSAGPPNDLPSGAIDVTSGGTFTADLTNAHDDIGDPSCGGSGGLDVFYSVTLTDAQVYYFDTFGSSFDSLVRVYDGACTTATAQKACGDDSCGGAQTQIAISLAAGTSCIVVDQAAASETGTDVTLNVIPGGRDGTALDGGMQTATGDTCPATNTWDPVDQNCDGPGSGGKDLAYFITVCPGDSMLLDADTCTGTSFDSVLYVRRGGAGAQVGCNDDDCNAQSRVSNVPLMNGVLFWLVVDGFDPTECGGYTLTTNLR